MFKKATKKDTKLRLAIFGVSGSGKTYTSLRIAKGLGEKIALIDTERRSASKYSDVFDFDVIDLEDKRIDKFLELINEANKNNYDVLIFDSLTHPWQELLQEIDIIAKSKFGGNSWAAWSEATPKQKKLIDAILEYPGHIIATMRCKTEWSIQKDENGKNVPIRIALSPEQGKGIEYEFDLLIEMSAKHVANIIKDRSGRFQDELIEKPGEEFGEKLKQWLTDDESKIKKITSEQFRILIDLIAKKGMDIEKLLNYYKIKTLMELPEFKFLEAEKLLNELPNKK